MKQMQVLGIELKDYPVREAMRVLDGFLQDAKVNTIDFLTMDILMQAGENEEIREWLSDMDLTVPMSPEILKAAGIAGRSRITEVEEGRFYKELLKKISSEKRTAFILAQKEEDANALAEYLVKAASGVSVVGSYAFENLTGDPDVIVNEINSTFPDLVLSTLSSPEQEKFVYENKTKLNARLWIALKDELLRPNPGPPSRLEKIRNMIRSKIFRRSVTRFTNEQANKGENS